MLKWVNVFLVSKATFKLLLHSLFVSDCCGYKPLEDLTQIISVRRRWVPVVFVIFFKLHFKTIPSVASFAAKFTCTLYYGKKLLLRHEKYYA